ncbi:MAG: SDR family NAD(P)-dependent oxidoreductase [Bryobacteraceae bacterium]
MDSLAGKLALVTGSSRGIGRAIALALGREGADVAVNFLNRKVEAEAVKGEVLEMGRRCVAIQADVSNRHQVEKLVGQTEDRLGTVEILINNAGIGRAQPMESVAEEDWDQVLNANLKSCFLMTQAVLPGMRNRKWGRIVNLSSVAAQIGGVIGPHYASSKAGMLGLTHFYAARLAKEGITVNAIAPALVETEMVTSNVNAKPDLIPVGRFGTPDEVAEATLMLVKNGYITGQTLNVNGGWFMS